MVGSFQDIPVQSGITGVDIEIREPLATHLGGPKPSPRYDWAWTATRSVGFIAYFANITHFSCSVVGAKFDRRGKLD